MDYEIHADTGEELIAVAQDLGIILTGDDGPKKYVEGFFGSVRYTINFYGVKNDPDGNPLPGVYAILRWLSDDPLPDLPAGSGVTVGPIPADSPIVFA